MRKGSARSSLLGLLVVTLVSTPVLAGPCSDAIADWSRKLAASPTLGPATTGALAGSGPTTAQKTAPNETPSKVGTSADTKVGGTGGTKELNAAVGQVATSADDVRRQQEGLPTAAQVAAQGSQNSVESAPSQSGSAKPDERMAQAKMELEKARDLDQKGDSTCANSIARIRSLASAGE